MQDRFKFRVWKGKENRIVYDVTYLNPLILDPAIKRENKHNILMQSTGLKDKNGKLIYEGDIVKFYDTDEMKAVVSWDDKELIGFYLNTTDYFKDKYVTDYDFYKDAYEVIGNIYENPELLEG